MLNKVYKDAADQDVIFVQALIDYDWPADVQPDIDALVAEVSAEAGWFQSVASSYDFAAYLSAPPPPERSAATIVRAKLAMPSNINSTVDDCKGIFRD